MTMTSNHSLSLLADLLLIIHASFILFVVGGQILILIGGARRWRWVRRRPFRVAHLLAIGFVAIQAWLGKICFLTVWENRLREAAGETTYDGGFIAHWVGRLVYIDAPLWVFTAAYTLFAAVVAASWFRVRPE